jgi:hypothetical protein
MTHDSRDSERQLLSFKLDTNAARSASNPANVIPLAESRQSMKLSKTQTILAYGVWIWCAGAARAQTAIDLSAQTRKADFSQFSSTKPVRTGTGVPTTCTIGELYFRTDGVAGSNLYGCTAADVFTLMSGPAAGQLSASQITDLSVARTSATQLTIGGTCSTTLICLLRLNDTIYSFTNTVNVTAPSGSGTVWIGVDTNGVRTAWHSLTGLTCGGLTCSAGAVAFPADAVRLAQCTVTSGAFDATGCTDLRALYGRDNAVAGTGLVKSGAQLAVNPVQVQVAQAAAVTFSATPAFDFSAGNLQAITLTANVTSSTIANPAPAQTIVFKICQDATGGRTFQWPSNSRGGMTVGTTASKCSLQNFVYDGSLWWALGAGASNL